MNLGTMRQEIIEHTHTFASADQVTRSIIDAIDFHRAKRLWWSERTFRFRLTSGREGYAPGDGYGLPGDLREIVGDELWLSLDGDPQQRVPIKRIPSSEMEWERSINYSPDEPFVWDFADGQLRVSPAPDNSLHILDGRYVRDIGVPISEYTAGAWVFKTPDGSASLDDAYTSEWFQDGRRLIRHYGTYLLNHEHLSDDAAAQRALQRWLEVRAELESESEAVTAGGLRRTLTLGI